MKKIIVALFAALLLVGLHASPAHAFVVPLKYGNELPDGDRARCNESGNDWEVPNVGRACYGKSNGRFYVRNTNPNYLYFGVRFRYEKGDGTSNNGICATSSSTWRRCEFPNLLPDNKTFGVRIGNCNFGCNDTANWHWQNAFSELIPFGTWYS